MRSNPQFSRFQLGQAQRELNRMVSQMGSLTELSSLSERLSTLEDEIKAIRILTEVKVRLAAAEQVEPIRGWRMWQIADSGGLRSTTFSTEWPSRKPLFAWNFDGVPDGFGYGGGIYALKTQGQLFNELPPFSADELCNVVFGEVALWGKIIEHERGYRAEYAYPTKLLVTGNFDPLKIMSLEEKYGVSVDPCLDEKKLVRDWMVPSVQYARRFYGLSAFPSP